LTHAERHQFNEATNVGDTDGEVGTAFCQMTETLSNNSKINQISGSSFFEIIIIINTAVTQQMPPLTVHSRNKYDKTIINGELSIDKPPPEKCIWSCYDIDL